MTQDISVQGYTVREFKIWLQGVVDMQGDDWVPNANQWKMVLQKLDSIQEPVPVILPPAPRPTGGMPMVSMPQQPNQRFESNLSGAQPDVMGGVPGIQGLTGI